MLRLKVVVVTVATALGMLLAVLDYSIVGTAMPTVIASLGGLSLYSWVFSVYALTSTATMPVLGRLSDIYGRKKLFISGLVVFVLGSALCGASQSMEQLIIFRALQGIGGAAIFALAFAIIGDLFPPEKRGRVQGVISAMWGISAVVGPGAGALIVETIGWRWVFFVNLPVSVVPILALTFMLKETPVKQEHHSVDFLGSFALLAGIAAIMLGVSQGGTAYPWFSPYIVGLLTAGLLLAGAFVLIQLRVPAPTVPLWLFRRRMFALGALASFIIGWVALSIGALIPLFAQGVLGGSAASVGVVLTPLMLGWSSTAFVSGQFVRALGYRILCLSGAVLLGIGFFLFTTISANSQSSDLVVPMIFVGVGAGSSTTALLLAMQNSVTQVHLGVATSLAMFFRNIGNAFGISLLGSFQVARMAHWFGGPISDPSAMMLPDTVRKLNPDLLVKMRLALSRSLHETFIVMLVLVLIPLGASVFMTKWQKQPSSYGD